MSLDRIGQELRQQRQLKSVSLVDIASETRINIRFLEAMEEGKFSVLPQTYVRAFIREYATIVGLDPNDMMQKYDEARGEKQTSGPTHPGGKPILQAEDEQEEREVGGLTDIQRKIVLGILIVAGLVVVYYLLTSSRNTMGAVPTQEIPFDRVVRETEASNARPESPAPATANETPIAEQTSVGDSLRLEVTTTDSVWISITVDSRKTEQYLMGPRRRRSWSALNQFVVSMGNAGGATYSLNGKDLGPLGKRGGVVRSYVINSGLLNN